MRKSLFLLVALVLFVVSGAFAQSRTVTGQVTSSEDGGGIPGVSVVVKGTTKGTQTNAEGEYRLEGVSGNETLVFSFVGFDSREEIVGSRSIINLVLSPSESALDELIVVGYGVQTRQEFTGSASTIKGTSIAERPVQSFA